MILGGGALQLVAIFIHGSSGSIYDALKLSSRSFVWNSAYLAGVVVCVVAAVIAMASSARLSGPLAVGGAVVAGFNWLPLMVPHFVNGYGHPIGVNGAAGVAGAALALVGGILAWAATEVSVTDRATASVGSSGAGIASAGWYPDPSGQGQRWWDGATWTEHTHL